MHGFNDFVVFAMCTFAVAFGALIALALVISGVAAKTAIGVGVALGYALYRLIRWGCR